MVGLDNAGKTATVRGIQGGMSFCPSFSVSVCVSHSLYLPLSLSFCLSVSLWLSISLGMSLSRAVFEIVPYSHTHYPLYSVHDIVHYIGNEQTRIRTLR